MSEAAATTTAVRLRPPHNRVERRAIGWWAVRALALVATLVGGLAIAYALAASARPWLAPILTAAIALGLVYAAAMPPWRYLVHRWETTDRAVYAATGWFVREWRIAPISRIQTVDTKRGPFEQLFGLATLAVTTASALGTIYIVGLDREVAQRVAQQLGEVTDATPGDAT